MLEKYHPSINRKIRSTYSSYFFIHLFFNPPFLSKNIYLYFTRHLSLHFHPSSSSSSVCNICLSLSLSLSLDSPLIWFLFHSASLYFTLNHLLESRKFESGSKINEKSSALDSAFSSKSCSILWNEKVKNKILTLKRFSISASPSLSFPLSLSLSRIFILFFPSSLPFAHIETTTALWTTKKKNKINQVSFNPPLEKDGNV